MKSDWDKDQKISDLSDFPVIRYKDNDYPIGQVESSEGALTVKCKEVGEI